MNLNIQKIKKKITDLMQEIKEHDNLYYIKNVQVVTNTEYDIIRNELKGIESLYPEIRHKQSSTQTVGVKITKGLSKIKHIYPMLSLNNAFAKKNVLDFFIKIKKEISHQFQNKLELYCEPKVDGISFSAYFKKNQLNFAVTRGDGVIGEDITDNIKVLTNFPTYVEYSKELEVRGEICISRKNFIDLNNQSKKCSAVIFSNSRNAASGSLRQLNSSITQNRKLDYFIWGGKIHNSVSQQSVMEKLNSLGFITNNNIIIAKNERDIELYYKKIYTKQNELNYDIDGLVYKVNNIEIQKKIGNINRAPKWAIAHKFPTKYSETYIKDILFQIGRTGAITPIAKLKVVNINGILITKASLHSKKEILKKDVRIGDTVKIKRAGDVIPQIIEVKLSKRQKYTNRFIYPSKCPVCKSFIEILSKEVVQRCSGVTKCRSQIIEKLCHFISKDAFNILGLSRQSIIQFYNNNLIKLPTDILKLPSKHKKQSIELCQGWSEKSINNLHLSINNSKTIQISRFIYSLSIRYIGIKTAAIIGNYFSNIDNIAGFNIHKITLKILEKLHDLGAIAIINFMNYFKQFYNMQIAKNILNMIKIETTVKIKLKIFNNLYSKKIIFTGTFKMRSRNKACQIAKNLGSQIILSISKKTNFIIYGNSSGKKLNKAIKIGVQAISGQNFFNIYN